MNTIGYGADELDALADAVTAEPEPVAEAVPDPVVDEDAESDEVAERKYNQRFCISWSRHFGADSQMVLPTEPQISLYAFMAASLSSLVSHCAVICP